MKQSSKRFFAALLVTLMITGLIPGGALFIITAQAAPLSISNIVTAVHGDGTTTDYEIDTVITTADFQITTAHNNNTLLLQTTESGSITVASGVTVTLVLNGAGRESADTSPLQIGNDSVVTLVLMDDTINSFISKTITSNALRPQAGIHVPQDATLIIQEGYEHESPRGSSAGKLTSQGGYFAAGIGGGANQNSGTISIEGGIIVAESNSSNISGRNNAAGIGGGGGLTNVGGNNKSITICGTANVTATSYRHGAGIGGGGSDNGVPLTSNTEPNSTPGAGDGGIVTIYGNTTVNATSHGNGAGIGGGGVVNTTNTNPAGASGTIEIYGTEDASPIIVAATGHISGADIGPGVKDGFPAVLGAKGTITITSGNVFADNMSGVTVLNELDEPLNMTKKSAPNAGFSIAQVVHPGTGNEYIYYAKPNSLLDAYMWLPTFPPEFFANITIRGVTDTNVELYKVFFTIDTDEDPYTISESVLPKLAPMWRLKAGEADNLKNISLNDGDKVITLVYETGLADVTIRTKLYGSVNNELDVLDPIIIPDRTIGESFGYDSIAILGYQLVDASGANKSAYTETITVDADPAENVITFLYKVATGNLTIICEDKDTGAMIHTWSQDIPKNTMPNISPPVIPNYTTTDSAKAVTLDADGNPEDITFSYTRDTAKLTLQAYNTLDGQPIKDGGTPITYEIATAQRVLESYNYFDDIAALTALVDAANDGLYTLVPVSDPINYHMGTKTDANEVRVYYNPVQSSAVIVECYIDSAIGTPIFSYTIPAAPGQSVTLTESQMPDLSGMGYVKNKDDSTLTVTEGTGNKIILIYNDIRFETKIIIKPDSLGIPPVIEKTVSPNKKMLYPPYVPGYAATQYEVTGNPVVDIDSAFAGYEATGATEITFYYEKFLIEPATGELNIKVIDAVTGAPISGAAVTATVSPSTVTFPRTDANGDTSISPADFGNYTIEVTAPGYVNATRYVTLSPSHAVESITIALGKPPSTDGGNTIRPAYLIIRCVDENGKEIFMQDINVIVGMQEIIHAPPLSGYVLAKDETARKTIRIVQGENVVIFRYVSTGKEEPIRPPVSDKVKDTLETELHIQYIQGYPDGTVRPDSNITRAEVASIFWRLLKDSKKNLAVSGSFDDVDINAWYAQAVNYLASIGILEGYEDGTFRPDHNITRAEFATLISHFDDLSSGAVKPFSDVPVDHWASRYIISAYLKGWVNGYPNGTFMPNNFITRAEVVKAVNYILGRGIKTQDVPSQYHDLYPDLPVTHWAFAEIIEASVAHDYVRLPDGYEIYK